MLCRSLSSVKGSFNITLIRSQIGLRILHCRDDELCRPVFRCIIPILASTGRNNMLRKRVCTVTGNTDAVILAEISAIQSSNNHHKDRYEMPEDV